MTENCEYGQVISDFIIIDPAFTVEGYFLAGAGLTANWDIVALTYFHARGHGKNAICKLHKFLQKTADKEGKSIVHLADPDNARSKSLFVDLTKDGLYRSAHIGEILYYLCEFNPKRISL